MCCTLVVFVVQLVSIARFAGIAGRIGCQPVSGVGIVDRDFLRVCEAGRFDCHICNPGALVIGFGVELPMWRECVGLAVVVAV